MRKQFVAAAVQATQYCNWIAGIDQRDVSSDEGVLEVDLAPGG